MFTQVIWTHLSRHTLTSVDIILLHLNDALNLTMYRLEHKIVSRNIVTFNNLNIGQIDLKEQSDQGQNCLPPIFVFQNHTDYVGFFSRTVKAISFGVPSLNILRYIKSGV